MNIVKHYHTRGDKYMTNNLPGWVILKNVPSERYFD